MAKNNNEALVLAQKLVKILSGGNAEEKEAPMPASADVDEMEKDALLEVAEAHGISVDGKKTIAIKALITTAAKIVEGDTDDLEKDEVSNLCEAVGVPFKKQATAVIALSEYFDASTDSEDGKTDKDEDEDAEDDDEPKIKKKVKAKDDDEDAETEDDGDDDEPKVKKTSKKSADEDDEEDSDKEKDADEEGDEDDDVPEKVKAKRLAAYNKVAKKPAKSYADIVKLMVDEDGDKVEWGKAYGKGENAYCCGIVLKDIKLDGEEVGKCLVTGKCFKQDDDGDLVEVEEEE